MIGIVVLSCSVLYFFESFHNKKKIVCVFVLMSSKFVEWRDKLGYLGVMNLI